MIAWSNIWVDLRRPDIFCDGDTILWKRIHHEVQQIGDRITKNHAYSSIQAVLDQGSRYSGGGFSYKFWFNSTADLDEFIQRLSPFIEPHVIDRLKVSR